MLTESVLLHSYDPTRTRRFQHCFQFNRIECDFIYHFDLFCTLLAALHLQSHIRPDSTIEQFWGYFSARNFEFWFMNGAAFYARRTHDPDYRLASASLRSRNFFICYTIKVNTHIHWFQFSIENDAEFMANAFGKWKLRTNWNEKRHRQSSNTENRFWNIANGL